MIHIRKALILTLALNIIAIFAQAQTFSYGLTGGIGVANARVINKHPAKEDFQVFYPQLSFNLNAHLEIQLSETFTLSAEPGYIRKGGQIRGGFNHLMAIINMPIQYAQLPILANVALSKRITFSSGPEFAYVISDSHSDNLYNLNYVDNKFEISGIIGFNYNFSGKGQIGLRYSHAFTKLGDLGWNYGDIGPITYISTIKNQYFQLIYTYIIR